VAFLLVPERALARRGGTWWKAYDGRWLRFMYHSMGGEFMLLFRCNKDLRALRCWRS